MTSALEFSTILTVEKDPKIQERESWLKILVVVVLLGVFTWKILSSPTMIDLSSFKFSDLLNLVLAMFAISLSIAFYFKATDTSNVFYDNTYRFTKEISEILGRIEAGFGERLRHLDEGYAGLRERFEKMPVDLPRAEQKIREEEEALRKKEDERDRLLEDVLKKARVEENERGQLIEKIRGTEAALLDARRELDEMRNRLRRADTSSVPARVLTYTKSRVLERVGRDELLSGNIAEVRKRFNQIKSDLHEGYLRDLEVSGFLNKNGELTISGLEFLRGLAF